MKRQAGSPMKKGKKAKVVDEVGPKISEIDGIISGEDCDVPGPSGNRAMLVAALPHALTDYSDVRHDYQKTVAAMIGDVMAGWVAKWEQKVKDAKEGVDSTETEKVAAAAAQESANASLVAQKEDVKKCKEALKGASEANKEAAEKLSAANKDVAEFDEGLQKIVAEKDGIEKVYNESFLVMKAMENVEAKDSKMHMKEISPVVKKIATEASLTIAVVSALPKVPAERGDFDKMAIDGVEATFKSKIEALSGEISSAGTTKAGKESAAAEAKAAHDATEAKRQECIAALKASQEAQGEKETALAAAEKATAAAEKAASKAVRTHTHEQKGLDSAKGNLASFQTLLERTTPPPPPEEPEEAPAEEAPAEPQAEA